MTMNTCPDCGLAWTHTNSWNDELCNNCQTKRILKKLTPEQIVKKSIELIMALDSYKDAVESIRENAISEDRDYITIVDMCETVLKNEKEQS